MSSTRERTPGPISCAMAVLVALLLLWTPAQAQQQRARVQPAGAAAQPEAEPAPVTAEERQAVVEQIAELLKERYVFEEKGREAGDHIRKLLAEGGFDAALDPRDFARELTEQLQSITHDKHMRVNALRPGATLAGPGPGGPPNDPAERLLNAPPSQGEGNYGFEKLESLPGNIGYLKLNGFASGPAARATATAAMNFLAGCDALIIDLRENGGGNPSMIQYISSYLFDQPTHLNSLYFREGDRTEEFWTRTDVPGERVGQDVPLFVLTSNYTFSGGEEFAYNIQTQKRGTLIGETTGGGANPGGRHPVGERFAIFVPNGRAINPITNTNWEGVGVKPEIELPAAEAYDKALGLAQEAARKRRADREERASRNRRAVVDALREAAEAMKADPGHQSEDLAEALDRAVSEGSVSEMQINIAGYGYLEAGQKESALALLGYNARRFPTSPNVHDSLGEALERIGRLEEAQGSYRRAVELGTEQSDEQTALYQRNLDRVTKAMAQESVAPGMSTAAAAAPGRFPVATSRCGEHS